MKSYILAGFLVYGCGDSGERLMTPDQECTREHPEVNNVDSYLSSFFYSRLSEEIGIGKFTKIGTGCANKASVDELCEGITMYNAAQQFAVDEYCGFQDCKVNVLILQMMDVKNTQACIGLLGYE